MAHARLACAALAAMSALAWASPARAIDLTDLNGKPIKLDVTETSIWAQHFEARGGELEQDQGYTSWLNRLNVALSWWRFTVGLRLDSSVYANRPEDQPTCPSFWPCLTPAYRAMQLANIQSDDTSRFRNAIYPAKLWASYNAPGLEVTFGDAYVQFGRGLILSMRKIDELGLDTTVRGGKLAWQADPFAFTFVAGFANPSRVDEATGRALFLPEAPPAADASATPPPAGLTTAKPLYGSDRVIGFDIQAGRGLPVTLATHAVRFTRCSPVSYVAYDPKTMNTDVAGDVYNGTFSTPFGSCNPADTQEWLSSLSSSYGPLLNASEIEMVGQSLEIPSLWRHGKLYVEAAGQHTYHDSYITGASELNANANGNAVYGSLSVDGGPLTNTLEVKSFRNFYPVPGAVDVTRAIEFGNVVYSIPPTTETITQDSELGFFGACVNGGRLRSNVRLSKDFLLYGAGAYYHSQTETLTGGCDSAGHTLPGQGTTVAAAQTYVWDGLAGFEWFFDTHRSHMFASTGVRDDVTGEGQPYYHEFHAEYAFTKHLTGPFSVEVTGRHRFRYEFNFNESQPWHEGENYVALKVSPKYVFSQGFEYTSITGQPAVYFNGSARYNFRSDSSVVLFIGEQRGGLRCVSGVCRLFPAFEGARLELTVRF